MGLLNKQNLRQPWMSETIYMVANPQVGGMATEDGRVILNPFSKANPEAIYRNESARLLMRSGNQPTFELTPEQNAYLDTTSYRGAGLLDRQQTIAARILTGDPTAQKQTFEQNLFVNKLRGLLDGWQ